jgi:hypothetical protein
MRFAPLLALLLFALPAAAQEAGPAGAYRDPAARELVRLAQARREIVDTRISAYATTAHERLSARMGIAGVERLLLRRETVSRIAWTRDTVRIELVKKVERESDPDVELHFILDNYATHKHPKVKSWLEKNTRVHFHFLPTSAS